MISADSPIIFLIIALAISIAWAITYFFWYLRKKNKNISHILSGAIVIIFMGVIGLILGIITNSKPTLIIVYTLGLGFMGAIIYTTMELLKKLNER